MTSHAMHLEGGHQKGQVLPWQPIHHNQTSFVFIRALMSVCRLPRAVLGGKTFFAVVFQSQPLCVISSAKIASKSQMSERHRMSVMQSANGCMGRFLHGRWLLD